MKLVTYESAKQSRLGVVQGDLVVDVAAAYGLIAKGRIADAKVAAAAKLLRKLGRPPADMIELLWLGEKYRQALGVVASCAGAMGKKSSKGLLTPLSKAKLRAPIAHPQKITCIGLNYADHAREGGHEPPPAPIFFLKSHNTICGPGDAIKLPPNSTQVDYEAEFAVVIGKRGTRIPESDAHKYIAGYTILHDVSARDMQFADKQWYRGKSCDTFAPTGPWIVTPDEISDPHNLRISLTLNGETLQDSNTSNLIFKVPFLISYLSQSATWEVGDLISTGTPPGVGFARKPPVFMKAGDTVSVTVEGIGTLTNPVIAA
ncbi:MAG: fumarylacetoacetate hydrolase family protein [Terriglobia bacterium]|jgi:2-keto-4-pentenoate hydratase/2-oxohepta-3-ene-1,7-dioic acid hydratase in catechol pathway